MFLASPNFPKYCKIILYSVYVPRCRIFNTKKIKSWRKVDCFQMSIKFIVDVY